MTDRALPLPAYLGGTWRRRLIAIGIGALSAVALPPFYLVPALWVGLTGLVLLCVTATGWRQAALEGWLFGLGWYGAGLYWVGHAFLVDADKYAALMPFAVFGLAGAMAAYVAAVAAAFQALFRIWNINRYMLAPVFAALWTAAEWLRGWVLTGFPWNPLSSVWVNTLEIAQSAAVLGSLGLTFVTALVFAMPAALMGVTWQRDRRPYIAVLLVSMALPLMWSAGKHRLTEASGATHDGILLRLVQPAIAQKDKWKRDLRQGHVIRQMAMSRRAEGPAGQPTHVIWAETNVPYIIDPESLLPASLTPAVPENGHLIFGAPRRDAAGNVYNSLFAIDAAGRIEATFDKHHLVPFGEYVPLRGLLPFERLTAGRGDFAPGSGPRTFRLAGLPPFAAAICYEIIFAGGVIDPADRPAWILNITNDAWFGPSTGPRQHLVQAQLRAIEEGLPVVRVANNGVSAVIDPYGRIRNHLDLDQSGVLDAPLPEPLPPQLFAQTGGLIGLMLSGMTILAAFALSWRSRRRA